MRIQSIVIYVLVIVLAASSVMAQQPQAADVWRTYSEKLEPGAYIRVRLKDNKEVKGHFILATDETLLVKPKTRVPVPIRDFKFVDIESIDPQKEGWSPGAKVLAGVVVGIGAVFAVVGVLLATLDY
jgi:hypothetical protein